MAAKKKAAQAGTAAWAAGKTSRPYVQRIAEDEELRGNLLTAYESARKAYGRLTNGKSPAKAVFDDKKLQKDIREAAESIRDASVALREAPQKRKRRGSGLGKLILLAIVGAAVAIAVSEDLRKKLLDALFGAEEEFEYTSTTTSPTDAGQPAGSAS
jgi:hypothetical protein